MAIDCAGRALAGSRARADGFHLHAQIYKARPTPRRGPHPPALSPLLTQLRRGLRPYDQAAVLGPVHLQDRVAQLGGWCEVAKFRGPPRPRDAATAP